MNGIDSTKIIKEMSPEKIVIAVTGITPDPKLDKIFDDVIYKPITNKKIINMLENHIKNQFNNKDK